MKKTLTIVSALSLVVLAGVSKDLLIKTKSGDELRFTTDQVEEVRFESALSDTDAAVDPYPSATDFSRKVLLMDHTGTACGNCPLVTAAFRTLEADEAYKSSYTLAALHSYAGDPMGNGMIRAISSYYMGSNGWPYVSVDLMKKGDGAYDNIDKTADHIRALIDGESDLTASGVSSNAKLDGTDLQLTLSVKAGEDGDYSVGAFVIEDGILAEQTNSHQSVTGDADFNTHYNVVRAMVGRQESGSCEGVELGSIRKGETASTTQSLTLANGWKVENCRLLIYVAEKIDGEYVCVNSSYAAINGETPFAYDSAAPATDSFVTLSKNAVETDYNAADLSVDFTLAEGAEASKVKASTAAYWIKDLKVVQGKITFSVGENVSESKRTGRISVTYGDARAIDITVSQACQEKEAEDLFTFTTTVVSPYSVQVDITPNGFEGNYLFLVAKAATIDRYLDAGNIQGWIDGDLEWLKSQADSYGYPLEEFLKLYPNAYSQDGRPVTVTYKNLDADTDYYIYAYGLDLDGTVTTDFYKQRFTTKVVDLVDLTLTAEVTNITGTSATIQVTPSDNTLSYYWTYVSEMDYSLYTEEFIMNEMIEWIRDAVTAGYDVNSIIHYGASGENATGLWKGTKYYLIGWGMDTNLTPTTAPMNFGDFTTNAQELASDCTFTIDTPVIKDNDIQIHVVPTDPDVRYVIAPIAASTCAGYNDDQMAQRYINMETSRFADNFYGENVNWGNADFVFSGEQTKWGRDDLDWTFNPQHDYNIYVFGVDNSGVRTTVVNKITVTTAAVDRSDMTFEITLDEEQSYWHYGHFNIKPSKDDEYFIQILVATEEMQYVTNSDGSLKEAYLCDEIEEFYDHSPNYYTHKGDFTYMCNWIPDTDYTLLVCGWSGGNTTDFFRFDCHSPAIPFNESQADVEVTYELFDGNDLAMLDYDRWKDYTGNVVCRIKYNPNEYATYHCGGVWPPAFNFEDVGGEAYLLVLDMNEVVSHVNRKTGQYALSYGETYSLSYVAKDKDGKFGPWHYEEFTPSADNITPAYDFWSVSSAPEMKKVPGAKEQKAALKLAGAKSVKAPKAVSADKGFISTKSLPAAKAPKAEKTVKKAPLRIAAGGALHLQEIKTKNNT